jgi:hypothetical protein
MLVCLNEDTTTGINVMINIVVGGVSVERFMIDNLFSGVLGSVGGSAVDMIRVPWVWLPVEVAAGQRIAANMKASTDSTTMQMTIIGFS